MLLVMRDLLDKQLVDRDREPLGRIDAIVMELRDGAPPCLVEFQVGLVPLARRFGRRAEVLAAALHRRWSVRRAARTEIAVSKVLEIDHHHIQVDLSAKDSTATDWERWLRRNLIDRLPGSGKE